MFRWIRPKDELSDAEVLHGLRMLLGDAIASQTMASLTVGPMVMAFAVYLGASNVVIGLVGAIAPLSQILQIPAVFIVEHTRMRKATTMAAAFLSRTAWVVIACIPILVPAQYRIPVFLAALVFFFTMNAGACCAFTSWSRDFIPEAVLSLFFSKRMTLATAVAACFSLLAGFGIDHLRAALHNDLVPYSIMFLLGATAGFVGVVFLGRIPEPRMHTPASKSVLALLSEPIRDGNFRALTFFLTAWSFAVNLCTPFFAAYMLKRLGLNMTWILGFTVLSQIMNVSFFGVWGRLAQRFSNKSVLAVAGPIFMFSLLLWPVTAINSPSVTIIVLTAYHIVAGISNAGVMLASNSLTYKSAPKGRATPYLAVNVLGQGIASTIAPILGGLLADRLEFFQLTIGMGGLHAGAPASELGPPLLNLHGLDFLFVFAFLFGLYALHRLLAVREEGETSGQIVRREFFSELERNMRQVSTVPGLRIFTNVAISGLGLFLGRKTD